MTFPTPYNEEARIKALAEYQLLDTLPEQEYDDIVQMAAQLCGTPISAVVLIDAERKWNKAKYGIDIEQLPREIAICAHTILQQDILVVNDTHQHPVFKDIGMVMQPPHVRFYAGVPIINPEGYALGTLCVLDTQPHTLDGGQIASLKVLASFVSNLFELRRSLLRLELKNKLLSDCHDELAKANQELQSLSLSDELTGLRNRRSFNAELKREAAIFKRHQAPLCLLMVDLDNFKQVNDQLGHQAGDKLLQKVASLMLGAIRESDLLARYGGEEFAIILPNTDLRMAQQAAERIRLVVEKHSSEQCPITVSIGIASAQTAIADNDTELIRQADLALYRAKQEGRNRVCL
ncbi:MAG: sensor domain-containing diguanylate cyclase [Porticoccaceae bacterium]|nr:sensor domain-containing diguanylate cyclase [Porticoccaceae bacterium]